MTRAPPGTRAGQLRVLRVLTIGISVMAAVLSGFLVSDTLAAYGFTNGGIAGVFVDLGRVLADTTGFELLAFRFGWRMIAIGALIGIVGPLIGVYVVHREMALIGETLAHTAFAGVAIGLLVTSFTGLETSYLVSALVVATGGAIGVRYLDRHSHSYGDVPIAIMLSGSFALGTLIISYGGGLTGISIEGIIFGNVSVVPPSGGAMMLLLSLIVIGVIGACHKQLLFITFDEQAASVAQLNVSLYTLVLLILAAFVVVGAMQILGVILVAAMLVIPVAAASEIVSSFRELIYCSILIGEGSALVGIIGAHQAGLSAGGTIVLLAIGCYLGALVLSD